MCIKIGRKTKKERFNTNAPAVIKAVNVHVIFYVLRICQKFILILVKETLKFNN